MCKRAARPRDRRAAAAARGQRQDAQRAKRAKERAAADVLRQAEVDAIVARSDTAAVGRADVLREFELYDDKRAERLLAAHSALSTDFDRDRVRRVRPLHAAQDGHRIGRGRRRQRHRKGAAGRALYKHMLQRLGGPADCLRPSRRRTTSRMPRCAHPAAQHAAVAARRAARARRRWRRQRRRRGGARARLVMCHSCHSSLSDASHRASPPTRHRQRPLHGARRRRHAHAAQRHDGQPQLDARVAHVAVRQ